MLSANPLLHTRSLRDSVRDVRSLFLHYLTDKQRRSYCASRIILSMSSSPFLQCFHQWVSLDCYCRNSILKAMMTQQQATQGLFRSPILAHFQKIPRSPVLFLSSRLGAIALMQAQVQIRRRITVSSDWKLKMADIFVNGNQSHITLPPPWNLRNESEARFA